MGDMDIDRKNAVRAGTLYAHAADYLKGYGVPDAARDAAIIVITVTGLTREKFYAENPLVDQAHVDTVKTMLKRRAMRQPLQYVMGSVEFCGLDIKVGQGVLVPRPETEFLVEEAASLEPAPRRVLDLCTGSGCMALAIASRLPEAEVTGTDSSQEALAFARANAESLSLGNVSFMDGDLFAARDLGGPFDLVVSNPPYIASGEIDGLMPEVSRWEPRAALDGGADGLDFYRRIIADAPAHMSPGAYLVLEVGAGQAPDVRDMLPDAGLEHQRTIKDLAGHERVVVARLVS